MLCLSRKNIGRDVKMQDLTPWAFEEASISDSQLLFRSGVSVDSSSSGYVVSIYGIDGEGSAAEWNNGTSSWAYWHMRGGWVFSPVGASSYSVRQGDVDGWAYGAQTSPSMPPSLSFDLNIQGNLWRAADSGPGHRSTDKRRDDSSSRNNRNREYHGADRNTVCRFCFCR